MIPDDVLTELSWLQEQSKAVSGATPLDDPSRQAADDFCKLAAQTAVQYGVSYPELSRALGLSPSTVRLKLGRHGYVPLPPSQKAYVGTYSPSKTRKKKSVCKRGHDLVEENLYYDARGGRRCKACALMHSAARTKGEKLA